MRLALALLLASACWAQTTPPNPVASVPQSASSTYLQTLLDPVTISLAAYDLSQVATSATAWKWTVNGQTYSVSAAKVTGIAAATTILGAYLAHRHPKLKPWITIGLAATAAYYGGIAYQQAQNHGTVTK